MVVLNAKCRYRPDAWNGHEANAELVIFGDTQQFAVQRGQLLRANLPSVQQRVHAQPESRPVRDEVSDPLSEAEAGTWPTFSPKGLRAPRISFS